jgi:Domain of unknown function (DUF4129)
VFAAVLEAAEETGLRAARPPWARAAAVVALLAPCALAARGGGTTHVGVHGTAARVLVAVVWVPLLLAIGWLVVVMLPELAPPFIRGRRRVVLTRGALRVLIPAGLVIVAVSIGILALSGRRKPNAPPARPPEARALRSAVRERPPPFPWWAVPVAAGGIAGAAELARRRARRALAGSESFRHARGTAGGSAADGTPVLLPDDPRAAVLTAWARMEAALARADLARLPGEGPRTYGRRVGGRPVAALTHLVEAAAFSPHPLDGEDRRVAAAALEAVEAARTAELVETSRKAAR